MSQHAMDPKLGESFSRALLFAADKHGTQVRKGGEIPYLGHLLSVASLVIEAGGTEDQAIAALLHDAAEDAGGEATLAEIRQQFGDEVANIVGECSDTFETPKPPWKERKRTYIHHLKHASDSAVLVSLADKLDNARAMLRDHRADGDGLWERFTVKDPADHLGYYRKLLEVFEQRSDSWMVDELKRVVRKLEKRVAAAS